MTHEQFRRISEADGAIPLKDHPDFSALTTVIEDDGPEHCFHECCPDIALCGADISGDDEDPPFAPFGPNMCKVCMYLMPLYCPRCRG